jgi:predicted nuclease of predicted toxin-antitoxin system
MRFMLDAGVPHSVGEALEAAGHVVIYYQAVLKDGATDELVARTAILNNAVLVALDKDMRQLVRRFGESSPHNKFSGLHLIRICCSETVCASRISHAMSFIEQEWEFTSRKSARRLWLDIGAHFIRSNR